METRVERYKKLREEIDKMQSDETSSKSKSSRVVNEILKDKKSQDKNNLSLDNTLKPYEFYDNNEVKEKEKTKLSPLEKRRILYIVLASTLVAAILIALVIVGIFVFH